MGTIAHFDVSVVTPGAVTPRPVTPGPVTPADAAAAVSASPAPAASAPAATSTGPASGTSTATSTAASAGPTPAASTTPTAAPASAAATASAQATQQSTVHAPATPAAGGGAGFWWLWLLVALVALLVVGMAVFRFAYMRSRRKEWYGLAMNAYQRGTALVDGLKSGQNRSEFTMYANDYDGLLRHLQERSPSEDARWTVARVSASMEAVRQAVEAHPGTDLVRTSVADLETSLRGLRDSALASAPDAQ